MGHKEMTDYSMGGRFSVEGSVPKDIKNGTVSDIKASPEKGKKRIIAREKSAFGQCFAVDIPVKEAKNIERKEAYSFQVQEKEENRYGGRKKQTGFKTYYCDEVPEKYGGGAKSQFKSFNDSGRLSGSRTRF